MLKPARANSWIVASCKEPFGMPSFSFIVYSPQRIVSFVVIQPAKKARTLTRVADVAVAQPLHFQQHRVIVAVDEDPGDGELVAGGFALRPEGVAAAAEEGGEASAPRFRERRFVHEADHQDFGALRVLDHGRYQSVEF